MMGTMSRYGSVFALLTAFFVGTLPAAWGESKAPSAPTLRHEMQEVFLTFKELQSFALDERAFVDPKNEERIAELLHTLNSRFYEVKSRGYPQSNEPGFTATVKVLDALLDDTENRFDEGRKMYALWNLKSVANYCVTCHARYEVEVNFYGELPDVSGLDEFSKGQFYFATRQFPKASKAFLRAARDPDFEHGTLDALRRWLIIHTRVQPDPKYALQELRTFLSTYKLSEYDRDTVGEWIGSLNRWNDELASGRDKGISPLRKAENLIRQGLGMDDLLSGKVSSVELLRASSILHEFLAKRDEKAAVRKKALYLLGLAYSRMPLFFIDELPQIFLEQVIREFPGSKEARESYRLYKEIVTLGYTGSGGTHIPDDVKLQIEELHRLAYSIPRIEDRA